VKHFVNILPYVAGVALAIVIMHDIVRLGEAIQSQN
jgi:hypothetical protein